MKEYLLFFQRHAADVFMIDVPWNGVVQGKKVGDLAATYQHNVAPHNHYSHLSTFMSASLCAALANVRIMEIDIDDVPWKDELVTKPPEIVAGYMKRSPARTRGIRASLRTASRGRPRAASEADSMNEAIKRIDPAAEFYTAEKCYIVELSNTPDDPQLSIARARVGPGVTTRWHRLVGTTERYVIIERQGSVEVGNLTPQNVSAGDIVLIPPSCRRRITNVGAGDLVFLAICTPRFRPEAYEDIDDDAR